MSAGLFVSHDFRKRPICLYGSFLTDGQPRETLGAGERTDGMTSMADERRLGEMRFMTVAEVAGVMRVSKMTVYRLVHSGELPSVRVGRSFRVPEKAVQDYLQDSFHGTA